MYSIKWSSHHPGLLVFLIDLSESMSWTDQGESTPRIDKVLSILSDVLDTMARNNISPDIMNPRKLEFHETFEIKVIGYNYIPYTSPMMFEGGCRALDSYLTDHYKPKPLFDTQTEAKPQYQTRTDRAFDAVTNVVKKWVEAHPGSTTPAPIVIHITDGHPEEKGIPQDKMIADCKEAAKRLTDVGTADGKTILINIHISPDNMEPLIFPTTAPAHDPKHPERRFLFDISTEFVPEQVKSAKQIGLEAGEGSRFMASNVSKPSELLRLIEFGSTLSQTPYRGETPFPG